MVYTIIPAFFAESQQVLEDRIALKKRLPGQCHSESIGGIWRHSQLERIKVEISPASTPNSKKA